jgi:transcriptional regulator with XRE-family HTH domain
MTSSKDLPLDIGQRIYNARKAADMSQEALAKAVRVNRSYLSLVENGRSSPTIEFLEKLAVGLDLRVEELILGPEVFRYLSLSPRHGYLYRGLQELLADDEQMLLMNPTSEEIEILKSMQLHPDHDPTKRFFIDALLDLRRTRT